MSTDGPTLLILAAGMGSRFGGMKQIEGIGPGGEPIIEYSLHDAIRAGFTKVVFVIRRSFEEAFREQFESKLAGRIQTEYVFQELDCCLDDFSIPEGREKPWGTGHAVLVAFDVVTNPFAVINADDYYGPEAYELMASHLKQLANSTATVRPSAMVGYTLRNTLSEHGTVSRGICERNDSQELVTVVERLDISKDGNTAYFTDADGNKTSLTADEIVSMNFWGFGPEIFELLQQEFSTFLTSCEGLKQEFQLPTAIDLMIQRNQAAVKVLTTGERWFGLTYPQDKELARNAVAKLVEQGVYPSQLWN